MHGEIYRTNASLKAIVNTSLWGHCPYPHSSGSVRVTSNTRQILGLYKRKFGSRSRSSEVVSLQTRTDILYVIRVQFTRIYRSDQDRQNGSYYQHRGQIDHARSDLLPLNVQVIIFVLSQVICQ